MSNTLNKNTLNYVEMNTGLFIYGSFKTFIVLLKLILYLANILYTYTEYNQDV